MSLFSYDSSQSGGFASRGSGEPKKINTAYRVQVSGKRGRPYANLDATLDGIWWILCTGSMWNQLPERYGKWNSVWRTWRRWCGSWLWAWILESLVLEHPRWRVLLSLDASHIKAHQDAARHPLAADEQKLGRTKGGCNTKLSAVVNFLGKAVGLRLVKGQEHDSISAMDTLPEDLSNSFVAADRGYDCDRIRAEIKGRGGFPEIPPKTNRVRPIAYDPEIGKKRHRVENFFGRIKRFRRIATRYDKLPETFLGFITLAAITDWITSEFVHVA
jgi:transposase